MVTGTSSTFQNTHRQSLNRQPIPAPAGTAGRLRSGLGWLVERWVAVVGGTLVLAAVGAVQLVNDAGWPTW